MLKRIITSVVALLIFIPVCIFSETPAFTVLFSLASFLGVYEMLGCTGFRKIWSISAPLMVFAAASPAAARFFTSQLLFLAVFAGTVFVLLFYTMTVCILSNGKYDITEAGAAFLFCIYIVSSFSCIILLRDREVGVYVFMLPIVGAWVSDIFAYFCGRLFGRHKLMPKVSPKKTVEGSIGGIVFTMMACIVYGLIISGQPDSTLVFAIIGVIISVMSQIGDLFLSAIKRKHNIKDYGTILPGHGGVLDRFDSVLATVPFVLLMCAAFEVFG